VPRPGRRARPSSGSKEDAARNGGASPPWSLGTVETAVRARLTRWAEDDVVRRIWRKDPTFWPQAPANEVGDRLGWLRAPEQSAARVAEWEALAETAVAEGIEQIVLLGMGGSSLAADVICRTLPSRAGHPELLVLDSTHPRAVQACADRLRTDRSLFLVSSKSGTTLEPNALFRFFWARVRRHTTTPGRQFAALTDPGSPLERLAQEREFRWCVRTPEDVGGRYSALTAFGLVPAALAGIDLRGLLANARTMVARCVDPADGADNPGLNLGAALGELALAGRDKVVLLASGPWEAFPAWAEQLLAESLGKRGRGIVPVAWPCPADELPAGPDVVYVNLRPRRERPSAVERRLRALESGGVPVLRIDLADPTELGAEFFRWEVAVAVCGSVLEVDPFDQPDVEHAKELARQAMTRGGKTPRASTEYGARLDAALTVLRPWLASRKPADYVGVQVFLAPDRTTDLALEQLASRLRLRLQIPVTVGYGPRFLHSTGQLHKGGPDSGMFLQLVDEPAEDLDVPELDLTFGRIVRAQAEGDRGALEEKHRRVVTVDVGPRPLDGVVALARLLGPEPSSALAGR